VEYHKLIYNVDDLRPVTQIRTHCAQWDILRDTHQFLDELTNFITRETHWVSSEVTVSVVQVNIVPLDCIAK
jgi:hypothetical protein